MVFPTWNPRQYFLQSCDCLKKKACSIPAASRNAVSSSQQVVPVTIIEENSTFPAEEIQNASISDNDFPAITLAINGCRLEINNHAGKDIILNTLLALQQLC